MAKNPEEYNVVKDSLEIFEDLETPQQLIETRTDKLAWRIAYTYFKGYYVSKEITWPELHTKASKRADESWPAFADEAEEIAALLLKPTR